MTVSTVGIIGGGQLARMLALAGIPLGYKFIFLDTYAECPAGDLGEVILAQYDDQEKLLELASRCDVLTFDFENVPASALNEIVKQVSFHPSAEALKTAQDRLSEKTLFDELGIPTPDYLNIESKEDITKASDFPFPAILKTRRLGYDGKGQVRIKSFEELTGAWNELGKTACLLEGFIKFDFEVSQVAVRDADGNINFYPLTENRHEHGILIESNAPFVNSVLESLAQTYTKKLLEHFDYIGVLAIEFFVKGNSLIINEMAPRVHNSGHWTIEGTISSQFENHIRAITGLPLGDTFAICKAKMINCLGEMPNRAESLKDASAHYHDYAKEARPGRKVGHITYLSKL